MEVSINSGISNIGVRNVDKNNEKTFGSKNVGQKSGEGFQDVRQKVKKIGQKSAKESESEKISQNWVNQHFRLSHETDGSP
jgi:hypothetical protein